MVCLNRLSWGVVVWPAQATVPAPLETGPTTTGLSPPLILGGSSCSSTEWRLSIAGGLPGGLYTVYETLEGIQSGFLPQPIGEFEVDPNEDGVTVVDVSLMNQWGHLRVTQETPLGIYSTYSAPFALETSFMFPTPSIPDVPLWECGRATTVLGHQPGDRVELKSAQNDVLWEIPSTWGLHHYMPVPGSGFEAGETVWTEYSTCGGEFAAASPEYIAAQYPDETLLAPGFQTQSLGKGATRFALTGVEQGATVNLQLTRSGVTTSWSNVCGEPTCVVAVPSSLGALAESDSLEASQLLCEGSDSEATTDVVPLCANQPAPQISPAPLVGDTTVHLSKFVRGGIVRVYATPNANPSTGLTLIGYAFDTAVVPLSRAITTSDQWIVVVADAPGCDAVQGTALFIEG